MHAMIDIETLNVGSSAPLFEIGICVFDINERKIYGSTQWNVDLLDVILTTGFVPSKETVQWWQSQAYDPRSLPRKSLKDCLIELTEYLQFNQVDYVWGNSPAFDCVLLERHYEACGLVKPWKYNRELDFRTIRWLRTRQGWEPKEDRGSVSHNAREDAVGQTEMLFEMLA